MHRFFSFTPLPGSILLSLLISTYAIILAIVDPSVTRTLCACAMLVSSLGDIILSGYKPLTSHLPLRGFIAGGSVFAFSHIIYLCAFGYEILINEYDFLNIGSSIGIFLTFILLIALTIINAKKHLKPTMLLFAMIYVLLICANCSAIFSIAASEGGIRIVSAIGVFSFLISDLFIALEVFAGIDIPHRNDLVWTFYPIGQILLLLGA